MLSILLKGPVGIVYKYYYTGIEVMYLALGNHILSCFDRINICLYIVLFSIFWQSRQLLWDFFWRPVKNHNDIKIEILYTLDIYCRFGFFMAKCFLLTPKYVSSVLIVLANTYSIHSRKQFKCLPFKDWNAYFNVHQFMNYAGTVRSGRTSNDFTDT